MIDAVIVRDLHKGWWVILCLNSCVQDFILYLLVHACVQYVWVVAGYIRCDMCVYTLQSQTEVGSKESIDLTMDLIPVQLGLQVRMSYCLNYM